MFNANPQLFCYHYNLDAKSGEIYQQVLKLLCPMKCKFKISFDLQIQPRISKNKAFSSDMEKVTGQKICGGNGTTESSFYDQYGYNCIILGPGNSNAHQPNEYITAEQLDKAVKINKEIIKKYCY